MVTYPPREALKGPIRGPSYLCKVVPGAIYGVVYLLRTEYPICHIHHPHLPSSINHHHQRDQVPVLRLLSYYVDSKEWSLFRLQCLTVFQLQEPEVRLCSNALHSTASGIHALCPRCLEKRSSAHEMDPIQVSPFSFLFFIPYNQPTRQSFQSVTDCNTTAMPRQRENQQRARQLGQDDHPTGSSDSTQISTHRPPQAPPSLLHVIRDNGTIFLRAIRADITALFRARLADFCGLPLWEKFFLVGIFIWLLVLIYLRQYPGPSAVERHCTSEWILDTAAPYHTTNQLCSFGSGSETQRFEPPATYKGVNSHGFGKVKLDLQYINPEAKSNTSVTLDRFYSYAPLELHFTQYVPNKANTISVSQLMHHNDGGYFPNKAMLVVYEDRSLGLQIGGETNVMAQEINKHYVVKARVPGRRCKCPDSEERSIFEVSETDYSTTTLAM